MTEGNEGRTLDVVVLGATGFVGRLVAEYLAGRAGTTKVGLAGRSRQRLEAVRRELGPAAAHWPLVVVDVEDTAALARLAASTRVVATTVGPYARYGLPLVRACAEAGTHYADLTGEVLFIRDSIHQSHDAARRSGARIVHSCGFDSVPSDLAVLLTAEQTRADGAGELRETTLAVRELAGGISGGTIDSMRGQLDAARAPDARRVLADPYALCPEVRDVPALDQRPTSRAFRDAVTDDWFAPFPMAPVNTRVVHRSNALTGWRYGRALRYREVVATGTGRRGEWRARGLAAGTAAAVAALQLPAIRRFADRLLPKPGEGPDAETRRSGHFRMEVLARTTTGSWYRTVVAASGDPGYAATSVMLGEVALALLEEDRLPAAAGVLTPATALGALLADRLVTAGFTIGTSAVDPAP